WNTTPPSSSPSTGCDTTVVRPCRSRAWVSSTFCSTSLSLPSPSASTYSRSGCSTLASDLPTTTRIERSPILPVPCQGACRSATVTPAGRPLASITLAPSGRIGGGLLRSDMSTVLTAPSTVVVSWANAKEEETTATRPATTV